MSCNEDKNEIDVYRNDTKDCFDNNNNWTYHLNYFYFSEDFQFFLIIL